MTQFVTVSTFTPGGLLRLSDLARIVDVLQRGGLSVLPTETGYMLAAKGTDIRAVKAAFQAKSRSRENPMHLAFSSIAMAESYASVDLRALRLLGELTPGPLTVVVQARPQLLNNLVTLNGTVGVRVPDHPATLQIIDALGCPLTATSLNESGQTPISLDEPSLSTMKWPEQEIVYIVREGRGPTYDSPSTLVRTTGSKVEVLRQGPISASLVATVAEQTGYLEASDWT